MKGRKPRPCPDPAKLRELVEQGCGIVDIVRHFDAHNRAVKRWLAEHGIPKPARKIVYRNPLKLSEGKTWQALNTQEKVDAAKKPAMLERFWAKVKKGGPDDCWTWTGSTSARGYGQTSFGGFSMFAHRVSWMIHFGPIPADMYVLHRCDNPPCINPNHLFLGTNQDNYDDRDAKGRVAHGERAAKAKLTAAQVMDIRASDEPDSVLGRRYGVYASTIRCARDGTKWKRLPGARPEFYEKRSLS